MSWVKLRMPGHPKSNINWEKLGARVAAEFSNWPTVPRVPTLGNKQEGQRG